MSEQNPREFWCNWMSMESSYEDAKDSTPKAEWEDLRCYVEKSAYDQLLTEALKLKEALEFYGNPDTWEPSSGFTYKVLDGIKCEDIEGFNPEDNIPNGVAGKTAREALAQWNKFRGEK